MQINNTSSFIINVVPVTDIMQAIEELLDRKSQEQCAKAMEEKLLTGQEVCKLFVPKITRQTLNNWTKKGLLKAYHLQGRNYYKYSEVMASAKSIKRLSQFSNHKTSE